jgi:hypothetical protein
VTVSYVYGSPGIGGLTVPIGETHSRRGVKPTGPAYGNEGLAPAIQVPALKLNATVSTWLGPDGTVGIGLFGVHATVELLIEPSTEAATVSPAVADAGDGSSTHATAALITSSLRLVTRDAPDIAPTDLQVVRRRALMGSRFCALRFCCVLAARSSCWFGSK